MLIDLLWKTLPVNGKDVVLIKVFGQGHKNGKKIYLDYNLIDHYDEKNNLTSMMRTTAYPVSINAQFIENGLISEYGVFGNEETIPTKPFFEELKKRDIIIKKKVR